MTSEAPPFWWRQPDPRAWLLSPLSAAYGAIAGRRLRDAPRRRVAAPVLCIGNFTVGGSGKTPVAIAMAEAAAAEGLKPGFLSRGHGGSHSGPHLVDAGRDSARLVGDEPLLLAAHAPTVVTADRAAAARLLIAEGCDLLIMDDGFHSSRIHIDFALIVVDATRGIGNGHVIPGGPLRARLVDQLNHVDAVLEIGHGDAGDAVVRQVARAGRPILQARFEPVGDRLDGRSFLAFAGIGNPERFFATVEQAGGRVAAKRSFGDHHPYSRDDITELAALADAEGLEIVTTAKDAARLRHGPPDMQAFLQRLRVLEIRIVFERDAVPSAVLRDTLKAWQRRRSA